MKFELEKTEEANFAKQFGIELDKMEKTNSVAKAYGVEKEALETLVLAVYSDLKLASNPQGKKNDKQKKEEILAIKDTTKRTREIAKNIELFRN